MLMLHPTHTRAHPQYYTWSSTALTSATVATRSIALGNGACLNMPSRDNSRLREHRGTPQKEPEMTSQSRANAERKGKTFMDQWVEPSVASQPSYQDHHGAPYGVLEHMQPLGEAPSSKVKSRARSDAPRKSTLGRSSAAAGFDALETPEGTPVPQTTPVAPPHGPVSLRTTPMVIDDVPAPPIIIDDARDDDYAPAAKKKKGPSKTLRTTNRRSDAPVSLPGRNQTSTGADSNAQASDSKGKARHYDAPKLKRVVDHAKSRAIEVGKPDLAAAVHEVWLESLNNSRLTDLLESILTQTADPTQTHEFQGFVKRAKRRLRDAKDKARRNPGSKTNTAQALPLRSPSATKVLPSPPVENITSALPSTESSANIATKSSNDKSNSKISHGRHNISGKSAKMLDSPLKSRARTGSESSELTDLTSDGEDGMEVDDGLELTEGPPPTSASANGVYGKDHAAERGSLAAPDRKLKRSSAEIEIEEDEQERKITAKKQKLSLTVRREVPHQESSLRDPIRAVAPTRSSLGRNAHLPPPIIHLPPTGTRATAARGSGVPSIDPDSPLSELSPSSSTQSTPRLLHLPRPPVNKRAKTKNSPEKKHSAGYGGLSGASGAGRESPIGDDDNEEDDEQLSENNDFCAACGGSGFLLCCDGCDRSFHFSCLDPPLNEDASELNEPWFCFICVAKRPGTTDQHEKPQRGLLAPLLTSLRKLNPANFVLPQEVRDYFEGVQTDRNGNFIEAVHAKTRNRAGYDELPDYYKMKDSKGNTVLCRHCSRSSMGHPARPIIQCDYCGENWHLDCLDPPLANPPARSWDGKKIHDWMCPLHADHELRRVDASMIMPRRKLHVRRPRNAKVLDISMNRGFQNNGMIDVMEDDSDDTDSEFFAEEAQEEGVVYRMPARGIKLDFIDKLKNTRAQAVSKDIVHEHVTKHATHTAQIPALQQANFTRHSFDEQQVALNLAQFATANQDLDLGSDKVQDLVGTLIAEAPAEVVDGYMASADNVEMKETAPTVPLSPPTSEETDQLSAEQRKQLLNLQELIRRKLENSKA
ncbi:hypothetical protein LTR62_002444 [Meristemomyces frigidus]|uniref:PHD-type domain-containing protein n=1 Tax=Meristemomyces frigidus TaxID=1508187 RepID=A0AAN7TJL1_9PEZI|nr:hypothetical protein LTR62_002444 [Meristemomyces frigidus]